MPDEQTIYLTVGSKLRLKSTGEAGEIVQVIDENHAVADFFDGEKEITNQEIITFIPNQSNSLVNQTIQFSSPKVLNKQYRTEVDETMASRNDRKNQFSYEIDLHADQLFDEPDTMHASEILPLQINRLKQYLNQAIELNVQRIYIIHGVGSGRLQSEVNSILSQNPKVKSYNNDYHPKYGKGATEVRFS